MTDLGYLPEGPAVQPWRLQAAVAKFAYTNSLQAIPLVPISDGLACVYEQLDSRRPQAVEVQPQRFGSLFAVSPRQQKEGRVERTESILCKLSVRGRPFHRQDHKQPCALCIEAHGLHPADRESLQGGN